MSISKIENKIKYSLILLILLSIGIKQSFAQKEKIYKLPNLDHQKWHFGYSLGLNTFDFMIRPSDDFLINRPSDSIYAVEIKRYIGLNINMIANLRLLNYLDIRFLPGLNFGQRTIDYKFMKKGNFAKQTMLIESTFIDLPIYFKYKAERINNWRPFLIGGGNIRYDLSSQKKINPEEMPKIRLKPFDVYYELGMGVDFFLEYFMFGIELKASWGLFNMVEYDNTAFTEYYKKLNSRALLLSFHFEGGKMTNFNLFKKKKK